MPLDLSRTYMLHIEAIIITFTHVIFLTLICCILKQRFLLSTKVNLWTACRWIFCFNERTLMLMEVRKLKLYGLLLSILALSHGKWRLFNKFIANLLFNFIVVSEVKLLNGLLRSDSLQLCDRLRVDLSKQLCFYLHDLSKLICCTAMTSNKDQTIMITWLHHAKR